MGLSQASIFLLAFLTIAVLVLLIKKNRPVEQDVVVYSLGFKEFEETGNDEEHKISGVLHVSQIVKKAAPGGNLTVVNVDFPMNGQDYVIMYIRVLNYNSVLPKEQLVLEDKDDDKFWILVSQGAIGSNTVTVEVNSYVNIDVDVEFYGYKDEKKELR